MKLPPFVSQMQLFRGNLHGHSTHSDGLLSPQAVIDTYAGLGYDFTCLSDHLWIDDQWAARSVFDASGLNRKTFITLPSAELHCHGKRFDQDGLWHIVANGLPVDFDCPNVAETAPDLIARARGAGAYVSLAHPEWYAMTSAEALSLAAADAVEVYNHSCVLSSARGGGIAIADCLLNEGHKINFTATDDSHFALPDFGGGWVMVAASELTQSAIIDALKAGHYYASTGPDFTDLVFKDSVLEVSTSSVESVVVNGAGHLAKTFLCSGTTETKFDLSQFDSNWFRITIRDLNGKMAWSNPYFISDLL